nr:alpha/beta fold hydrolase [Trinickia acidisoli]
MSPAVDATATLEARLARFPVRVADLGGACVSYREASGPDGAAPLVLLHGIGSGAASWVQQFEVLGAARRVLAWDAPGYGASTPVAARSPIAADYALRLRGWLDALGIARCVLVGHSLGAIVAGAFAAAASERLDGLLLLSPAGGYGAAPQAVRAQKRDARLAMLAELGSAGLARQRSDNMLSSHADDASRAWVRWNMARVVPHGYAQATHLLANADLVADLAAARTIYTGPVEVAVGEDDAITPPAACEAIARAANAPFAIVPGAGHAGYVEAPDVYNALIDAFCRSAQAQRSI